MRIAVIGGGYVGLATVVGFARRGHAVELYETEPERQRLLRSGALPFLEPSLAHEFRRIVGSGVTVADSQRSPAPGTDFVFICVDTPPGPDGSLNTAKVMAAAEQVAESTAGTATIVVRSTVTPGTTATIESTLNQRFPKIRVLVNPEFLREGHSLHDFDEPDRRVVGGASEDAVEALAALYDFSSAPLLRTDSTSAELIKLSSNAALAVRVSMVNEIASVADAVGADLDAVLEGVGSDPRIGRQYLRPGLGFGGSCLPKDLDALRAAGRAHDISTQVFDATSAANDAAIVRLTDRIIALTGGADQRVAIVGIGFKPGSDSVRESRPLRLVRSLLARQVRVSVYDPMAESSARRELGGDVEYLTAFEGALDGYGVVLLAHGAEGPEGELPPGVTVIDALGRHVDGRA